MDHRRLLFAQLSLKTFGENFLIETNRHIVELVQFVFNIEKQKFQTWTKDEAEFMHMIPFPSSAFRGNGKV